MDVESADNDRSGIGRRRFLGGAAVATGVVWSAPAVSTLGVASAGSARPAGTYCAPMILTPTPATVSPPSDGGLSAAASVNFGFGFSQITAIRFSIRTDVVAPLVMKSFGAVASDGWGSTWGPTYPAITYPQSIWGNLPNVYSGLISWTISKSSSGPAILFEGQVCIDGTPA